MSLRYEKGSMTLEACVSVTSFLVLSLFLANLFPMFMAQNATGHALLETAQSLSVDVLAAEQVGEAFDDNISIKDIVIYISGSDRSNGPYATNKKWHKEEEKLVKQAVKARFIAFLAGDEESANSLLKRFGVEDGVDGLDFSETYIEDDELHIVLRYSFEDRFSVLGINKLDVKQTSCSVFWKKPDA